MAKRWTEAEINYLIYHVNCYPFNLLCRYFNKKFPKRTIIAIKHKITDLKLDKTLNSFCYFTPQQLAKEFNVPISRIAYWREKGLKFYRSNRMIYFKKKDIKAFAYKNKSYFRCIDFNLLDSFFDSYLAKEIINSETLKNSPIAVKEKYSGKIFKSIYQASQILNISESTISREIKRQNGWLVKA